MGVQQHEISINDVNNQLKYSTQQSACYETKNSSASQKITGILWNPRVHHFAHNSSPINPTLSPISTFHAFVNGYCNIILILSTI